MVSESLTMDNLQRNGVYTITNTQNGWVYVGSCASGFAGRWADHRKNLRKNQSHNRHLQNAWNKYGEHSFEFSIIEIIDDLNLLVEREQYWLDYYLPEGKCYNILTVAYSSIG